MKRFSLPLLLLALSLVAVGCDENGNGIPDDQEANAITNTDLGAQSSRPQVACPIGRDAAGSCIERSQPTD